MIFFVVIVNFLHVQYMQENQNTVALSPYYREELGKMKDT